MDWTHRDRGAEVNLPLGPVRTLLSEGQNSAARRAGVGPTSVGTSRNQREEFMADTPNHEYNVPAQGDQDWHQPLNENFEAFEVDIELRDQESNLGNYQPTAGAKFLATDTGVVYRGDGNSWAPAFVHPEYDDSNNEAVFGQTVVAPGVDTGELTGSITGGTPLTNIAGNNLSIDGNGQLNASTGGGGGGGNWTVNNNLLEPSDSNVVGIDVDEVNAATLAAGSGPLQLTVNGASAFQLEAESNGDAGNVVAGHSSNSVSSGVVGSAILGGGFDDGNSDESHTVTDNYSVIAGGRNNEITGFVSAIAGGSNNVAGLVDAVGGGTDNEATGTWTAIPGGVGNEASGRGSLVAGGQNTAVGEYATVTGGSGDSSKGNTVYDNHGTISGGSQNQAGSDDGDSTTATHATVSGGLSNVASAETSTIGGGENNEATETAATVGGGRNCHVNSMFATAGGGQWNELTGAYATIAGGEYNEAYGYAATIAGGGDPDSDGTGNVVHDDYGAIGGGGGNVVGVDDSTDQPYGTVSGGQNNEASASHATVAGGQANVASGEHATVLGGRDNEASGNDSLALGRNATADNDGALVFGDSTSDSVESMRQNEARFQNNLRAATLKTEGDVWYYADETASTAQWRTRYDTTNDEWQVDQWDGFVWATQMWVTSNGDVKAQGSKDFVQTVDTDDGEKEVHYSASEAGTPHTEVSGVAELDDGRAEIDLPDHFGMVTSEDEPLVVQTTPYGGSAGLKVVERSTDRLVVEDLDGDGGYEFAYTVKGTREGYEDKQVVREPSTDAGSGQMPSPADD